MNKKQLSVYIVAASLTLGMAACKKFTDLTIRLEKLFRIRIEGEAQAGISLGFGLGTYSGNQFLMSAMATIEVTDRNRTRFHGKRVGDWI